MSHGSILSEGSVHTVPSFRFWICSKMAFPNLWDKNTFAPTGATTPIQRKLGNSWRGRNRYLDVCIDRKGRGGELGGDTQLWSRGKPTLTLQRGLCASLMDGLS